MRQGDYDDDDDPAEDPRILLSVRDGSHAGHEARPARQDWLMPALEARWIAEKRERIAAELPPLPRLVEPEEGA